MRRNPSSTRRDDAQRGAGRQRPAANRDDDIDIDPAAAIDADASTRKHTGPPDSSSAGAGRSSLWRRPGLAFILSAVITVALAAGSGIFNTGPSEADLTISYNDGFAAGSEQTRADLEADFVARANAITDEQIREAELRSIHAGFELGDELRALNFDDGYDFGYIEGAREAQRRLIAAKAPRRTAPPTSGDRQARVELPLHSSNAPRPVRSSGPLRTVVRG